MLLTLTSTGATKTDNFIVQFTPPIPLDQDLRYECALVKANLWYSWYNISADKGNNQLTYNNGTSDVVVTFPDGQYNVTDINSYLHTQMKNNGDYTLSGSIEIYDIILEPNFATNKILLTLNDGGGAYTINFSTSDLYLTLGFDAVTYSTTGVTSAPNIANINDDINSLLLRSDLITGSSSYLDSSGADILFTFVPQDGPGTNIEVNPQSKIYIPINQSYNEIKKIRCYLTDQLGRRVNLNNEPMTFLIHIRPY